MIKIEEYNQSIQDRIMAVAGLSQITKSKVKKVKNKVEQQSIRVNPSRG